MYRVWTLGLATLCFLAPVQRAIAFAGAYSSGDGELTLVLVQEPDGAFEGTCVVGERTFYVEGESEDGRLVAECFTVDTDIDEEHYLVAAPGDSALLVQIMPLDEDDGPDWSRAEGWQLLPMGDTALPLSLSARTVPDLVSDPAPVDDGATSPVVGDTRLVGRWVRSESMTSGELTMVARATFVIAPDGTFAAGGAEVVGGGSLGAFESGPGEEVITGQWTTEAQIFYVRNATSPGWIPLARYNVEGASLLFIFGDGTRELWKRI